MTYQRRTWWHQLPLHQRPGVQSWSTVTCPASTPSAQQTDDSRRHWAAMHWPGWRWYPADLCAWCPDVQCRQRRCSSHRQEQEEKRWRSAEWETTTAPRQTYHTPTHIQPWLHHRHTQTDRHTYTTMAPLQTYHTHTHTQTDTETHKYNHKISTLNV